MKKIAFWNNYTEFSNNQAFNPNAYGIGEDLAYPLILLKDTFYFLNHHLSGHIKFLQG